MKLKGFSYSVQVFKSQYFSEVEQYTQVFGFQFEVNF